MVASKTLLQLLSLLIAVMAQEPTDLSYGSGVSANLTAATRIRLNAVWDYMVKGNGNIADQVQILYVKGLNNFCQPKLYNGDLVYFESVIYE